MAHLAFLRPRRVCLPRSTSTPCTPFLPTATPDDHPSSASHHRPRRHFSSNATLMRSAPPNRQPPTVREKPQQSLQVLMKQQKFPEDFGLLPGTFIRPAPANRPSLFSSPRSRLALEWHFLRSRIVNLASVVGYITTASPRLRISRRRLAPTAVALHQQMYTAFAAGNIPTLSAICGPGLLTSFSQRLSTRAQGTRMEWRLDGYTRGARVMSDRAARLPVNGAALRQVVVRIESEQTLTKIEGRSRKAQSEGAEARKLEKKSKTREYIVIQRMVLDGKEREWKVWGTTEETGIDWVREEEAKAKGEPFESKTEE